MKYKIVRKSFKQSDSRQIITQYFVMEWTRKWYQFKPQWNNTLGWEFIPMTGGNTFKIACRSIKRAEEVIFELCKKVPPPKDIKIIECK